VSTTGLVLDTPRAAFLDCDPTLLSRLDGEAHVIGQVQAGDADAREWSTG
jgi:hypothetical protein